MSTPILKHTAFALSMAAACSAFAQQSMPEVIVSGAKTNGERASIGGFGDAPLLLTPASITAITRNQLDDLGIRNTSAALKLDASVSDSYNAVGYSEQFSIRGFNLDNATSYRKDGFAIPGDAQIPLENKERIEVLKGLAGLQAGVAAPGGIINYVTKRPTATPLRSAVFEVSERGTIYTAADLGGRFDDKRFGYRINAAAERIRSYVKGADGNRQFFSGAFDWQITPQALLQLDMDYQHKAQVTVPGYQLLDNLTLPTNISADTLLNAQPWTKPVDTRSSNIGLRFEYQIDAQWRATVAANKHHFMRDDYTAFPYGCGSANLYPGYCANGDYDVYDYQSVGESKSPFSAQAQLQGKVGAHELTFGTSLYLRHDRFGDYVYDYAGTSNIYHNVFVPPAPPSRTTGPVTERVFEHENAAFVQDIVTLSNDLKIHAGARYVQVHRNNYGEHHFALPNLALVFTPARDWTVYASLAHGLEHGGVAPLLTTNENTALEPSRSKQFEFGSKAVLGDSTVSAAIFQIRKGLEYTDAHNTFVRNGEETHRGLELSAQGKAMPNLAYNVSLLALNTRQQGTGQAGIDGKRVTDVPAFRSTAALEYALPQVPGLKLNGTWQYSGKKAFDVENKTMVPDYHLFNFGAAYAIPHVTLRAFVDNAFNKFYWRDVTPALGGYLLPGASRTFKLSAQLDF